MTALATLQMAPAAPAAPLRVLFMVQLVAMGAMEMSAPFWPLFLQRSGQLSTEVLPWAGGVAYAGPMLMAMLSAPLWGRMGDRTGHKAMLLRALAALALTQLWIGCTDSVAWMLAARLVQGALAGFIASAQAYGGAMARKEERGALMARLQVATAIGSVAGPVVGGVMYGHLGFQSVNLLAAAVCAACIAPAWIMLPADGARARSSAPARTAPGFSLPAPVVGLLLAIVLVQAGKMMPQAFFGVYAEQVLRLPAWLAGLAYGAPALGLCIAAPVWARRFATRPQSSVLRDVAAACWASVAVCAVQAACISVPVFIGARVLWGVCLGALLPVFYTLLSNLAPDCAQGRVLGAGNSAAKAGALAGIAAGALTLAQLPVRYLFWPMAGAYVVAALAIHVIRLRAARAMLTA